MILTFTTFAITTTKNSLLSLQLFEDQVKNILLSRWPPNYVILDNASYSSRQKQKILNCGNTKQEILAFFDDNALYFEEAYTELF